MKRDYQEFSSETTIIEKFEEYEDDIETDLGEHRGDWEPWYSIFKAGFMAGGAS